MSPCNDCPTPDNCENCVHDNTGDLTIESMEFGESSSVHVEHEGTFANHNSVEATTADFVEAPAVVRLINQLGKSAGEIHELAKELHPGDAGICVSLAAQIGAVADMFVQAVNNVMEAEANQTENNDA